MPAKKRYSAFDDLNANGKDKPKVEPSTPVQPASTSAAPVERIERLKPSQMVPDRFQPRRLLPVEIRADFFSGKLNCYQAAMEWLALAHSDPGTADELNKLLA